MMFLTSILNVRGKKKQECSISALWHVTSLEQNNKIQGDRASTASCTLPPTKQAVKRALQQISRGCLASEQSNGLKRTCCFYLGILIYTHKLEILERRTFTDVIRICWLSGYLCKLSLRIICKLAGSKTGAPESINSLCTDSFQTLVSVRFTLLLKQMLVGPLPHQSMELRTWCCIVRIFVLKECPSGTNDLAQEPYFEDHYFILTIIRTGHSMCIKLTKQLALRSYKALLVTLKRIWMGGMICFVPFSFARYEDWSFSLRQQIILFSNSQKTWDCYLCLKWNGKSNLEDWWNKFKL